MRASIRAHLLVLPRVDKEEDANEHECPDANSQPKQIQTHVQLNHAFVRVLRLFSRRRAMWSASLYVDDFGLWKSLVDYACSVVAPRLTLLGDFLCQKHASLLEATDKNPVQPPGFCHVCIIRASHS
jgi:hypothetical protein